MYKPATLILLAALALAPVPGHAKWIEASSRHFVLLAEGTPKEVLALARNLERFDQAARQVFQLPDPEGRRVTLYVVDRETVEHAAGPGSAGAYLGRATGATALVGRSFSGSNRALFHEYAHHLLQSHHAIVWPFWLSEGSAEFLATAEIRPDGGVTLGSPLRERAFELEQIQYVELAPLLQMSDASLRAQPALSYTRAWLLVHHLVFTPARQGQLARYLNAMEQGVASSDAARGAFGPLVDVDRGLKSYAKAIHEPVTVPSSALQVSPITLREPSAAEQVLIPHRLRYQIGFAENQAREALRSIRTAAAPFPNDAVAQAALAEAELYAGNHAAAELAADRALSADPALADAHLYKGRARMDAAWQAGNADPKLWQYARQSFITASELEPQDPEPLALSYVTFLASGQRPTSQSIAGLYKAHELARQDHGLRVLVAYQYLVDGKAEEARRVLSLLASDPRTDESGARIQDVLDKLQREGVASALETFDEDDLARVVGRL